MDKFRTETAVNKGRLLPLGFTARLGSTPTFGTMFESSMLAAAA